MKPEHKSGNEGSKGLLTMSRVAIQILVAGVVSAAVIGCGGGGSAGTPASSVSSSSSSTSSSSVNYTPKGVLAGIAVSQSGDQGPYKKLVAASSRFGHRADPFQLTSEEASYDKQQNVERVLGVIGGFTTEYELPPEQTKDVEPQEPQPYRRLAGVVVGDSVLAIIDMGDGQATTIIRPGMKIPNSEWTVVSINEDRAILHRDGTVSPHTVSVRLETPPSGGSGALFGSGFQNGAGGAAGRGMGPGSGAGGNQD